MARRRANLTPTDLEVLEAASRLDTGGMAAFTQYFFSPIYGVPRWDLVGKPLDTWDLDLEAFEYVPWVPLPWQVAVAHESRMDGVIIGGFGCGKTVGVGAVLTFLACMIPNFKGMDVAPTAWQAKQMFDAIRDDLVDYNNRDERPRRIVPLVTKFIERPYPKVTFWNNSTLEFMSADEQGAKIRSWNGDVAVIDEAGQLQPIANVELEELLENLGSRLRGQTGGRARIGKLIVMSNADYDPALWERYDMAELDDRHYFSIHLTTYDNPYLSKAQIEGIERRIPDPARRRQLMMSERPLPKGKEFTPELLSKCMAPTLDDMMDHAIQEGLEGYRTEETHRAGIIYWATPANELDQYVILGDPGQSPPPERNSAVIMVFKVSNVPHVPAELAGFWWGPTDPTQAGSYWPFIYQFEEWYRAYRCVYAGYDSTGVQKGFNELVFAQRGMLVEGINLQGQKMRMVVALKLLMGQGMLLMPRRVAQIWLQLANWRLPDTKLKQDIASCLFMAGDVITRLFVTPPDLEDDDDDSEVLPATVGGRLHDDRDNRLLREDRHVRI